MLMFRKYVALTPLAAAIMVLLTFGGCGDDQTSSTSDTGSTAAPTGGPPPPPVNNQTASAEPGQTTARTQNAQPQGSRRGQYPGADTGMATSSAGTRPPAEGSGLASSGPGNAKPPAAPVLAEPVEGFEVGNIAPEIYGEDVDGEPFRLSDYRGKVVVVDFWGDW